MTTIDSRAVTPKFDDTGLDKTELDHTAFDRTSADVDSFTDTLDLRDVALAYTPSNRYIPSHVWFRTIETLSPTKTIGLGRTNTTLIMPTIVQTDAATPYAGFDRTVTSSRNPTAQVHFEPGAYGATTPATYVISFAVETSGPVTFTVQGLSFLPGVSGLGSRVVNGTQSISVVYSNLPANQPVYAYIEQTAGGHWNWYSTRISYPPIVLQL
ncbi:hypothetical protein [Lacisediminihabitans sp. H27-G8]|uniref:hypothetical protein n=1 Tax=Lacisediminihabitans sp. H27-G8 TaxID=3111909 RepID=UPI0038FC6CD3